MLTLKPASLDWALQHALTLGDADAFPLSFEFKALEHCWKQFVRTALSTEDVHSWRVRPHRSVVSAKAQFGFRIVTQLDPLDFLLYTAVVYEISAVIESRRVPTSKNIVFSYRVKPTKQGRLFDPSIGYAQFVERAGQIVE